MTKKEKCHTYTTRRKTIREDRGEAVVRAVRHLHVELDTYFSIKHPEWARLETEFAMDATGRDHVRMVQYSRPGDYRWLISLSRDPAWADEAASRAIAVLQLDALHRQNWEAEIYFLNAPRAMLRHELAEIRSFVWKRIEHWHDRARRGEDTRTSLLSINWMP